MKMMNSICQDSSALAQPQKRDPRRQKEITGSAEETYKEVKVNLRVERKMARMRDILREESDEEPHHRIHRI